MQGSPYEFFVQWHLTERCNLCCRHCYQDIAAAEMSKEEIYRAIDQIQATIKSWVNDYDLDISPGFHFTGGEPLLRNDLPYLLDYSRHCGFSTSLLSNGTLISANVAEQLREAGVRDVQVSLDGTEQVHDKIRGAGSFRQALHGIENLVHQGVDTYINMTISRLNVNEIDGLVNLAREMGIQMVTCSRLVLCGRGRELADHMLTTAEIAAIHEHCKKYENGDIKVASLDPLALVANADREVPDSELPVGGCAAGIFGITITSDGSLMPCRRMDLVIGNIKTDSLRHLWVESPVLCALRDRERYHGSCGSCYYWSICRGCRAIALAFARNDGREDYLGPD
ncbi:MAG: radical SAM protein, partial [Dehalococcoidia bacterium]